LWQTVQGRVVAASIRTYGQKVEEYLLPPFRVERIGRELGFGLVYRLFWLKTKEKIKGYKKKKHKIFANVCVYIVSAVLHQNKFG
jgi:hypothetical protein